MSRPRVRRRSDGILEIIGLPSRRRGRHPLALALASAVISGAAVVLTWIAPELLTVVWIPAAAAAAALLASTLLLWRPRARGVAPRPIPSPPSSEPDAAPVRPIKPAPGTRGA